MAEEPSPPIKDTYLSPMGTWEDSILIIRCQFHLKHNGTRSWARCWQGRIGPGTFCWFTFAYDSPNRLLSTADPLGTVETYTYDGNDNVPSACPSYDFFRFAVDFRPV